MGYTVWTEVWTASAGSIYNENASTINAALVRHSIIYIFEETGFDELFLFCLRRSITFWLPHSIAHVHFVSADEVHIHTHAFRRKDVESQTGPSFSLSHARMVCYHFPPYYMIFWRTDKHSQHTQMYLQGADLHAHKIYTIQITAIYSIYLCGGREGV